jgi:hypothetical protein
MTYATDRWLHSASFRPLQNADMLFCRLAVVADEAIANLSRVAEALEQVL